MRCIHERVFPTVPQIETQEIPSSPPGFSSVHRKINFYSNFIHLTRITRPCRHSSSSSSSPSSSLKRQMFSCFFVLPHWLETPLPPQPPRKETKNQDDDVVSFPRLIESCRRRSSVAKKKRDTLATLKGDTRERCSQEKIILKKSKKNCDKILLIINLFLTAIDSYFKGYVQKLNFLLIDDLIFYIFYISQSEVFFKSV